jgi:hypothetical protein
MGETTYSKTAGRKLMVIVDETAEVEGASTMRPGALSTDGHIVLLYVMSPTTSSGGRAAGPAGRQITKARRCSAC